MDSEFLFQKLNTGYTSENMNRITEKIITAYKNKNTVYLRELSAFSPECSAAGSERINKLFFRLMMQYHPDRLGYYQHEMASARQYRETFRLEKLMHIFSVLDYIDNKPAEKSVVADVHFDTEVQYEINIEDFDTVFDIDDATKSDDAFDQEIQGRHFISALKHKEYGNLNIMYREPDLMNMEGDLELSGLDIEDLSGIELCQNLTGLDLSGNRIDDITLIGFLPLLETVDLSGNQISRIDAISRLEYVSQLDLSFNMIRDISPLFELARLQFVNLMGNPVPAGQIDFLRDKSIIIVY